METFLGLLMFLALAVVVFGGFAVALSVPAMYRFAKKTRLSPVQVKIEMGEIRAKKREEARLDSVFSSYSEGAKILLDSRPYSHICQKKKCGRTAGSMGLYTPHYDPYAKELALADYQNIADEDMLTNENIEDVLAQADLFYKKRLKDLSRRYGFDISEITDDEWKLITKEYNDHLIMLARNDTNFTLCLDAAKVNNQHNLKIDFFVESERQRLSAMTAEELKNETWQEKYENA